MQRARGLRITVVEYEDLIRDSSAELGRLAAAWRLDGYLQLAKRTVTSTTWLWERKLRQRRSVRDDVIAMGLPRVNVLNHSVPLRDACRAATKQAARMRHAAAPDV